MHRTHTFATILIFVFTATSALARDVSWTITRDVATLENNQTIVPVRVDFHNAATSVRTLAATVKVIDYFRRTLGEKTAVLSIGPAATLSITVPVATDLAGPHVKVNLEGMESAGPFPHEVHDEQILFTDVLTGPRPQLSLNGTWDVCPGDAMASKLAPPTAATWDKCELPFRSWTWGQTHRKWFRKTFLLPEEFQNKTVELRLSGVRFRADVFLNGQSIGGFDTDQMPERIDLTRAATPGQQNELLIAVTDWLSCVAPELKSSLASSTLGMGQGIPGQPFIRPCTGADGAVGISDPIMLVGLPDASLHDVYITPSVRKSQLTVRTIIDNSAGSPQTVTLTTQVLDGDTLVLAGKPQTLTLASGQNEIIETLPVDLKQLTLWAPGSPHLYRLQSQLVRDTRTLDQLDSRFGFREFWTDGEVFRINGIAIKPAVAAAWPYSFPCIENTSVNTTWHSGKLFLQSLQRMPITMFRYHTEPFPILMYDLADELGLMIISEAIMSSIPGRLKVDDPRLWNNLHPFYAQWVHREFNHPSLVIRSIENEMGYFLAPPGVTPCASIFPESTIRIVEKQLKQIGCEVKKLDPSRPIMYDGGGPIFYDIADIYNPHYPHLHGFPSIWPIPSRWISMPIGSYYLKSWEWDRKKPLFVGEYGVFSQLGPESYAGRLGNDAYIKDWCVIGQVSEWKMSAEGMRIDGVTAAYPWTMLELAGPLVEVNDSVPRVRAFRECIAPIATFIHQYRHCYFGNRSIRRTLTTINDTLTTQNLTVRWTLQTVDGKSLQHDQFTLTLDPSQRKATHLALALPTIASRTPLRFIVETFSDNTLRHTTQRDLTLFADETPKPDISSRIALLGLSDDIFSKASVPTRTLDAAHLDLADVDIVLASGDIRHLAGNEKKIEQFIRTGGRWIILAGPEFPTYLPFALKTVPGQSVPPGTRDDGQLAALPPFERLCSMMTIVHPRVPNHPLLKDLDAQTLRFWREDHVTAEYTFEKPTHLSSRSILDGAAALLQTPLIEIPCSRGLVIAMQMPILEHFPDQPAARILFANLLEYADTYRGTDAKRLALLADPAGPLTNRLNTLDLKFDALTGQLTDATDLSAYGVILVDGSENTLRQLAAHKSLLAQYVRSGGIVWLHTPEPPRAELANAILPIATTWTPLKLESPIRVLGTGLFAGISNDELFWPDRPGPLMAVSDRVARFAVDVPHSADVAPLTDPAVGVQIHSGSGRWLIDTLTWDTESAQTVRVRRFLIAALTNMNIQLQTTPPTPTTSARSPENVIPIPGFD